jgi:CxxC motif-containing protein
MICLSCPIGCELRVHIVDGEVSQVEGNRCPRGEEYAKREAIEPMRILPSSVRVIGGTRRLLSVKTDRAIPLRLIAEAMKGIRRASVRAPVEIGDIVLEDLLGTGANVVATREIPRVVDAAERSLEKTGACE